MTVVDGEHPPLANKTALVDFDATIAPWGPLFEQKAPHPEIKVAMQALIDAGYRVLIFTSRMSKTWLKAEAEERGYWSVEAFFDANLNYVKNYLDTYGIPYDQITAEKVPAEVYFDDKAVRVTADDLAEKMIQWLEDRGVS